MNRNLFPHRLTDSRAYDVAKAMLEGFVRHYRLFSETNREAKRRFELADFVRVERADLADGLLTIDLVREVPEAIRKATDQAKRAMIRIPLREGRTLHHDVHGHFGSGKVVLRPAKPGTGIIAGPFLLDVAYMHETGSYVDADVNIDVRFRRFYASVIYRHSR